MDDPLFPERGLPGGLGDPGMFGPSADSMSGMTSLLGLLIAGAIAYAIFRYVARESEIAASATLSVAAVVLDKRSDVRSAAPAGAGPDTFGSGARRTHTDYYVTFETLSGLRLEFELTGSEYGHMVAGDRGTLTYQGPKLHGFERGGPQDST